MSTTETSSAAQRKLAYPDELMRMHASKELVLIENHHPIKGTKLRWHDDPAMKALVKAELPKPLPGPLPRFQVSWS